MRFDLDRLPTDPVLLQKMLREMAEAMELERAELKAAKATVKAQNLTIEKLEHRLARLLRVQFGRSSEKMDIAQLRLMFEDVETPEPAAAPRRRSARTSLKSWTTFRPASACCGMFAPASLAGPVRQSVRLRPLICRCPRSWWAAPCSRISSSAALPTINPGIASR